MVSVAWEQNKQRKSSWAADFVLLKYEQNHVQLTIISDGYVGEEPGAEPVSPHRDRQLRG